ncbi:MAG: lipoprotein signal peptidase [Cytophagales bacterium]|nr:MAG: lipoprotein signal peptidase [Cytophagales bacterium]TAF60247.1 MAG: lipoprotein signal peptidase [Cytophagales bacterium]
MQAYLKYFGITLLVILIDQATKLAVHHYMMPGPLGEIPLLGNWFKLHYTLNPGMAFGIEIGSMYGKLSLTVFRSIATLGIAYLLTRMIRKELKVGLLIAVALILGGAIGNVLDSLFYGVVLEGNAVYYEGDTPLFHPWLHGQVIDMIYLDLWEGYISHDIPLIGGMYLAFWPIFNIADSSIFIGVAIIAIWQRTFFPKESD